MTPKAQLLVAALAGVAFANPAIDVPGDGAVICNSLTRPDYAECHEKYLDALIGEEIIVGPDMHYGRTFTFDNCQIRFLQCANFRDGIEFAVDHAPGLFTMVANTCEASNAGGIRRQGDLCIVVDNPSNPFLPETISTEGRTLDRRSVIVDVPAWPASQDPPSDDEVSGHSHPRDLLNAGSDSALEHERRQEGCTECESYSELAFHRNLRGERFYVCDNILPDGASCTETHTATITESFEVGFTASAGLFDIITAGASFTTSYSEAVSVSLSTTITVNCPGGSGYIVWYPLIERSTGDCFTGDCAGEFGTLCTNTQRHSCGSSRPIMPGPSRLSGEYDYICV